MEIITIQWIDNRCLSSSSSRIESVDRRRVFFSSSSSFRRMARTASHCRSIVAWYKPRGLLRLKVNQFLLESVGWSVGRADGRTDGRVGGTSDESCGWQVVCSAIRYRYIRARRRARRDDDDAAAESQNRSVKVKVRRGKKMEKSIQREGSCVNIWRAALTVCAPG